MVELVLGVDMVRHCNLQLDLHDLGGKVHPGFQEGTCLDLQEDRAVFRSGGDLVQLIMGAEHRLLDDWAHTTVEELALYVEWEAGDNAYDNAVTLIPLLFLQFVAAAASFSLFGIRVMIHT